MQIYCQGQQSAVLICVLYNKVRSNSNISEIQDRRAVV